MCYSAQLEFDFGSYVRETGAEMDLAQFEEIFGQRAALPSLRIPRAVERWFDHPEGAAQKRIKALINDYRTANITKFEQEVFAQRKRLADAERTLAVKTTKAASESKRIATDKVETALRKLEILKSTKVHSMDSRIFPMHYAPIVIQEGTRRVIRLARYLLRPAGKPASFDRQFPGCYNARRDNLTKFWKSQFGHHHALMLVSSFYENVDREGRNAVLHFVPRPADTMRIACLYSQWVDPKDGSKLLGFAAITDEPPAEVAAAGHDRMIVNLKSTNVAAWLTPEGRSVDELQAILSDRQAPYYEHEVLAA